MIVYHLQTCGEMVTEMKAQIRQAGITDLAAIRHVLFEAAKLAADDFDDRGWLSLRNSNTEDTWRDRLKSDDYFTWVAEVDRQVVGYIGIYGKHKLYHLFVLPQYPRQGIASELWQVAKTYLQRQGAAKVVVNASSYAQACYRHWGFEASEQPQHSMGIRCLPMQLEL